MLAKLPPAISFEFRRNEALRRPSLSYTTSTARNNDNTNNLSNNGMKSRKKCSDSGVSASARVSIVARAAAYTRRKLETAGAYELIDDETGDKVIVWGDDDVDVDDSVISKDVLQWKPEDSKKVGVSTSGRNVLDSDEGEYKSKTKGNGFVICVCI